jgi:hypothetical protein
MPSPHSERSTQKTPRSERQAHRSTPCRAQERQAHRSTPLRTLRTPGARRSIALAALRTQHTEHARRTLTERQAHRSTPCCAQNARRRSTPLVAPERGTEARLAALRTPGVPKPVQTPRHAQNARRAQKHAQNALVVLRTPGKPNTKPRNSLRSERIVARPEPRPERVAHRNTPSRRDQHAWQAVKQKHAQNALAAPG